MDENDLKLIVEISKNGNLSQRDLSHRTNLSLGLVNLILKRLTMRGYIKVSGLNSKKVNYFLTPKGFAEKAKKSYAYIFKTIDLVKRIREEIDRAIIDAYKSGERKFAMLGEGSLADLVNLALKEMKLDNLSFEWIRNGKKIDDDVFVLITDKSVKRLNGNKYVNLSERLADVYWGVEPVGYE